MADGGEDRRAALAAAALMASTRGDIGFRDDSSQHWLALADEAYRWLANHNAKESTMTEDAAAAEAAEDVTPDEPVADEAAGDEGAESAEDAPEAEAAEDAPEGDAAPDAEPAA